MTRSDALNAALEYQLDVLNSAEMFGIDPELHEYYDASQAREQNGRWTTLTGAAHITRAGEEGARLAGLHKAKAAEAAAAKDKVGALRHAHTALAGHLQAQLNAKANGQAHDGKAEEHLGNLEQLTTNLRIQAYHAKKNGAGDADERKAAFEHAAGITKALKNAHKAGAGLHVAHHFGTAIDDGQGAAPAAPRRLPRRLRRTPRTGTRASTTRCSRSTAAWAARRMSSSARRTRSWRVVTGCWRRATARGAVTPWKARGAR